MCTTQRLQGILLILSIFICFGNLKASDCSTLDWTKEIGRTQGAGWIWFTGKATSPSIEESYQKAEGMALDRLVQECIFPHKEVKFHERCDENSGEFHTVYVRASIKDKQCRESKYAKPELKAIILNKPLQKKYNNYLNLINRNKSAFNQSTCNASNINSCYKMGKHEYFVGNLQKSIELFDTACKNGHIKSCFNSGLASLQVEEVDKAVGYFQLACSSNHSNGCLFLGKHFYSVGNKSLAKNYLKKAAVKLKNSEAHYYLGLISLEGNNRLKAKEHYTTACRNKHAIACKKLSSLYYKEGNTALAHATSNLGCSYDLKESCFNAGYFEEMKKSYVKSSSFYIKSCDLGLDSGCYKAAIVLEKRKSKRFVNYYVMSCEKGISEGCENLSKYYFKKGNLTKSALYASLLCKFGSIKGCHNTGFLEFKLGNLENANEYFTHACNQKFQKSCNMLKVITQ